MEDAPTTPSAAAELLDVHQATKKDVRAADDMRRNLYVIWGSVAFLLVMPFDFIDLPWSVITVVIVICAGLLLTAREVRRSRVINQKEMVSYSVVFGTWSIWWSLLMTVIAPALGDRISFSWTVTGLLATLPYIGGLIWEARR